MPNTSTHATYNDHAVHGTVAQSPVKNGELRRVAMISSVLPRRCGIATFANDLLDGLAAAAPRTDLWSIALNDKAGQYQYANRVQFEINENHLADYRLAAEFLNANQVGAVSLQHEYGIFGGPDGKHILELLSRLRMPIVTTLHTVLKEPSEGQKRTLQRIAELSDRLIVMAHQAESFLTDIYDVPAEKVTHIHHGIPDVPFIDPSFYKDQFGVEGRKVILTFGLLGPGKGIENVIEALPAIVKKHPDAVYVVVGATHPGVLAHNGEEYRLGLQRRARELGVADHLQFHNRFVDLAELCEFLCAADIYVTPYLSENQICSGTLAYALGTGNAVVSTPYWYAKEMLADGRGICVPFKDPAAMAKAMIDLFDNETERHAIRKKAYAFSRQMIWPAVAGAYLNVFGQVIEQRQREPRPTARAAAKAVRRAAQAAHAAELAASVTNQQGENQSLDLPEVRLDHLRALTDDTGVLSEARGSVPRRAGGYTTDDNARALMVSLMAEDYVNHAGDVAALTGRCLAFLEHALDAETGRFRTRIGYDRRWMQTPTETEAENTGAATAHDAHGRALRALGETVSRSRVPGHITLAAALFHQALPVAAELPTLRAKAFVLLGCHAYLHRYSGETSIRRTRDQLATQLFEAFEAKGDEHWPWPTETLEVENARLPHALLVAGRAMNHEAMMQSALRSLRWLLDEQTTEDGHLAPIGTRGGRKRGCEPARFDQLPVEVSALLQACLEAHEITKDGLWREHAHRCLGWFLGDNDLRQPLVDHATGACADALEATGVSRNQGAAATLTWLRAVLALHEYEQEATPMIPRSEAVTAKSAVATLTGTRLRSELALPTRPILAGPLRRREASVVTTTRP